MKANETGLAIVPSVNSFAPLSGKIFEICKNGLITRLTFGLRKITVTQLSYIIEGRRYIRLLQIV